MTATIVPAEQRNRIAAFDWTYQNRDYFQAVEVEKKMMFVIMFFISLVASINLISTLIMTVTEKQAAIAVALNVGAIVSAIEQMAGRKLVTSAIYFIDYMPSQVKLSDVLAIVAISLGLSFVATLLPSWRASKTQPAEALRYE